MTTLGIVEHLDVVEDVLFGVIPGLIGLALDGTRSMSYGRLFALSLSLSFLLSLNWVCAESAFVLIDDRAQSLDEINMASLSDL